MKNIELKTVKSCKEMNNILYDFNFIFFPALENIVNDLDLYAKKLYDNAINIKAMYKKKIVGFTSFYCNDNIDMKAYLTQIAVKSDYQNHNVGQLLLNKAMEISLDQGMRTIVLEVYNNNDVAKRFYKKNGFKETNLVTDKTIYMMRELNSDKKNK